MCVAQECLVCSRLFYIVCTCICTFILAFANPFPVLFLSAPPSFFPFLLLLYFHPPPPSPPYLSLSPPSPLPLPSLISLSLPLPSTVDSPLYSLLPRRSLVLSPGRRRDSLTSTTDQPIHCLVTTIVRHCIRSSLLL